MSAIVILVCDQPVPESPHSDLCGSRITWTGPSLSLAQALDAAARRGWTVNDAGDACPGCSGRSRRPVLRPRKRSGRRP